MILARCLLILAYKIRCFEYYAFIIVISCDSVVDSLLSRVKGLIRFLASGNGYMIYLSLWFRIPHYHISLLDY
jgi:hypothetical protein